ncbi:MAG: hypothetical protein M3Y72_06040, partial [Acidobacteriota bacterium]|nr:hypothetical protein [Acidobacteriota bacterium]
MSLHQLGSALALPLTVLFSVQLGLAQARQPHGLPARASANDYAAHVQVGDVTYAASLLSPDQVKHTFAFDVSKMYLVFEVAVYPGGSSTAPVPLDPKGFVIGVGRGDVVHRADAVTVASVIQQKNLPKPSSREGSVVASTEVGYESGTDPYTGRRVHGTYTDTQVGVGTGRDNGPTAYPRSGGYPQDRQLLEDQLWDKSLPENKILRATAGYIYFPISLLKKQPNGLYTLEY